MRKGSSCVLRQKRILIAVGRGKNEGKMQAKHSFKKLVCEGEGGYRITSKKGNTRKRKEICWVVFVCYLF